MSPVQELMTNPHSPIVDFYPPTFEVDMEGKRAEWEAIVLIPFIDQARLLAAEASIPTGALTDVERSRNQPGAILIFSHDENALNGEHYTASAMNVMIVGTISLGPIKLRVPLGVW
jgi:5'-3' exonuclease